MASDSDSEWDPASDTKEEWSDAAFGDLPSTGTNAQADSSDVPLIITITAPTPTPKPTSPAAHRVFAIPELLEQILLDTAPSTSLPRSKSFRYVGGGEWEDAPIEFLLNLQLFCNLRRVSTDFDQTILGSRKLRARTAACKATWQERGGPILWLMEKMLGSKKFKVRPCNRHRELGVKVENLDARSVGVGTAAFARLQEFCEKQGLQPDAQWRKAHVANGRKLEVMISRAIDGPYGCWSRVVFDEDATLEEVFEWYRGVIGGKHCLSARVREWVPS